MNSQNYKNARNCAPKRVFGQILLTNLFSGTMIKARYGTDSTQTFSNKINQIGCSRMWNGFYNISFRAVEINIKGGLRNEKNH